MDEQGTFYGASYKNRYIIQLYVCSVFFSMKHLLHLSVRKQIIRKVIISSFIVIFQRWLKFSSIHRGELHDQLTVFEKRSSSVFSNRRGHWLQSNKNNFSLTFLVSANPTKKNLFSTKHSFVCCFLENTNGWNQQFKESLRVKYVQPLYFTWGLLKIFSH